MSDISQPGNLDKIKIGDTLDGWDGLSAVTPSLHLKAPPTGDANPAPDQSRYPNVVGTGRLAVTEAAADIRKRSWMGWFLWGDGTPPPGAAPGYAPNPASTAGNGSTDWDFHSWQYSAGYGIRDADNNNGHWQAVRLGQQVLYLNPFRLNYNWPAGKFGYLKQPLQPFANNLGYWAEKKIARGPNLSFAYPYFVEYADYVDAAREPGFPDEWRNSWLYVRTRPLECLVMVPGIETPQEMLAEGAWNQDRRTAFNEPGQGNYLKMTVAQGAPLVWCETHNSRYVNFYNLLRTNEIGHIDDTGGTRPSKAGMALDPATQQGVFDVPGVEGVQFVLLCGNQTNPNQFYHEVDPFKWDRQTGQPGGWNPPGQQSNHTYIAVYFKKDTVAPVDLARHSGADADGNPYFFLEFNAPGQKNWYVVGAVPVMSYYHSQVAEDDGAKRFGAARAWAESMGRYAFNFLTATQISFKVANMYQATTTYKTSLANPFVACGQTGASSLTADPQKTVIALMPHHYQPITLGPDLTLEDPANPQANQVVWQPLQTDGADLLSGGVDLPNANKSDPDSPGFWGYWSPRGNLRTLAAGGFSTVNLFQNFLPLTPPPNWDKEYVQTSIQGVRVVDLGTGYQKLPTDVDAPDVSCLPKAVVAAPTGTGAQLQVILQPHTDKIQQIDVIASGWGYPDGNPPAGVTVKIDPPDPRVTGGRTATARVQIGGGRVLAVFMTDQGAGYRSVIKVSSPGSSLDPDAPLIVPRFANDGSQLMLKGLANVVDGGSGWQGAATAVNVTVMGAGTGAKAEIIKPGQILQIRDIGMGFTSPGKYPSSGDPAIDAQSLTVHAPPPGPGASAQGLRVASVNYGPSFFKPLITDTGQGYASPGNNSLVKCVNTLDNSEIGIINIVWLGSGIMGADLAASGLRITTPLPVAFTAVDGSQAPVREAKALLYLGFSVGSVELADAAVAGYQDDQEVAFSGGDAVAPGMVMPVFDFDIVDGRVTGVTLKNPGKGFYRSGVFKVEGGKGFNAALRPVMTEGSQGTLFAVKVVRAGSNYPDTVYAYTSPLNKPLNPIVENGRAVRVELCPGVDYSGFGTTPAIFLTSDLAKDFASAPAKGKQAEFILGHLKKNPAHRQAQCGLA